MKVCIRIWRRSRLQLRGLQLKNARMIGSSLKRFHQDFARRKFFSDKCFKQRERVGR